MVDPLSYFSFQPVLYDLYDNGHVMSYPVCGMVHIYGGMVCYPVWDDAYEITLAANRKE